MNDCRMFMVTVDKKDDARNIARTLIEERLAACVNILPGVESHFRWKGKIDKTDELMLIIKSTEKLSREIIDRVKQLHPYDLPEIIILSIEGGSSEYLNWIKESVAEI